MGTSEAPPSRYRIAEVGRLTGFAPTTLRYYEKVGVLAKHDRTASGYRLYTDRDVERLRLIARAKSLGCTLAEISRLVQVWDADDCAPVQHLLAQLVRAKADEVRQHIARMESLTDELAATEVVLGERPVTGPCVATCGCVTTPETQTVDGTGADGSDAACSCGRATPATAGTPATGRAEVDAGPIGCSLDAADAQARIDDWRAVLIGATREPIAGGVRLLFGPAAPLGEISRLAVAEHACCPFFAFTITVDARGVALEVTAPAHGRSLLDDVFGVAG